MTVPRLLIIAMSWYIAAAPTAAQDEPYNQTAVRERLERIVTIDGDLRRDGAYTAAAMPWPRGWGELRIGVQSRSVAWESDSAIAQAQADPSPDDEPLREQREEGELRWRQNMGAPWLNFEAVIRGSREDRTEDHFHLGDLETTFVIPIFLQRYHAIAVAIGALHPLADDGADWLISHGSLEDSSWTGKAEIRGSFGIQLATLQIRAGGFYTPHGANELPGSDEIVKDTYLGFVGAVGVTYRFTRWLRLGAEQSYANHRWQDRAEESRFTLRQISAPLLGSVELTPKPGMGIYVQGFAGTDLAFRDDLDDRDCMIVGAQLTYVH
jgi:hypothetical protein